MPAQSQQQQKLFGLALAYKRGEVPASEVSDEIKDIADRMSEKEIEDFAATKHKGLPKMKEQLRKIVREIMREQAISELNEGESVNEEQINEIGVLGVASGVALGLIGVIALSKGVGFAKRKFGDAMSVAADKLEKKVKKIESDKVKQTIINIGKKFENDRKLQDMYQTLPAYKERGNNSQRKKGMAEIAKYVKSKLSADEMKYFYDLNTYLRTNKIKGTLVAPDKKTGFQKRLDKMRHDSEPYHNESVSEGASRTAMEIGGLTGMNKDAIQKFVDDNNLDIEKVFQYVKKGKLKDRMDLVSAIAGKPNNPVQKKMIKMFGESVVNEGYSTEEKRIIMMAVRKLAKYRNVPLEYAITDLLGAGQELERDIKKGKIK